MRLKGEILEVSKLSDSQKERMFELLSLYFDGVTRQNFNKDLSEKEWVIILRDQSEGEIQGFSTQKLINLKISNVPVNAVFSGDTIIHKDFWGESELVRVWLKFIISLAKQNKHARLYWFLITKGYKTYRYLPVYFKEFYPCYNKRTPAFEEAVLNALAHGKFPKEYKQNTGIIHFEEHRERLKYGVAEINDAKLKNPHIRFFVEKNPLHWQGDELACITELKMDNLKPSAFRLIPESIL